MYIYKAAVVGAGAMGGSIAQVITYSGLPVVLKDINQEQVDIGLQKVRSIYQGRVDKGRMSAGEMQLKMNLITGTTTYDGFEDVDIVIEAVPEDLAIKQQVYAQLDQICPEHTILASNTSALSITALAAATQRPGKVVGMHFFNPAHVMKLVEIIPGLTTDDESVDDAIAFGESLRKLPVRVHECAGFLVNRLLCPYLNEAVYTLQEGTHSAAGIDDAMRGFGWPMGPFTLADMLGLDICLKVGKILYESYGPRMQYPRLLELLVEAGRFGQKSGKGVYNYENPGAEDKELEELIEAARRDEPVPAMGFSVERLNYGMINEAVICLQEGVSSISDIDIAMMAGTGFPQEMGGPMKYADTIGIDTLLAKLEELADTLSHRLWPAPMLKRMIAAGHLGVKSGQGFYYYG